jgi:hypothetical protein
MRRGQKYCIINLVKSASKCAAFTRAQSPQYGESLFKARTPLVKGNAESIKFGLIPASSNAENETTLADLVNSGGHLGEKGGWVKANAGHEGAEFDAFGDRGQRRQQGPGFPRSAFGATVATVDEVIANPHRVKTFVFGGLSHGLIFGPADFALDLRQLNANSDAMNQTHPYEAREVSVYGVSMGQNLDIRSDPTTIDAPWMNEALRASGIAGSATITKCTFESFVGTGQTGCNARFSLEWDNPVGRPKTVMGKFPSFDETARATGFGGTAYVTEFNFYSRIASTVNVRAPKCYHAALNVEAQQFCLIMEDLSGSEQGDQFVGLTLDEAELAIDQAVLLHAPRWGDPTLPESGVNPSTLEERSANLAMIYGFLLPAFVDRLGARLEPEILKVIEDAAPVIGSWALGSGTPLTVAHYDFRPDNFMFAREPDAPPLVVVDWQTVNEGLGMVDVAYLIAGSFSPERRREVEKQLIESYRVKLNAAGINYDVDTCWRDYRFGSIWGLIITVLATSMAARTERGDDLFVTMATQYGHLVLDHDALSLLK